MFQLSTRARYGVRAMGELAVRYGDGPVQMSAIADSQSLSRKYLHALLTTLKQVGLVRSVRGAAGGFVLSRSPESITVLEVIEALEGPVAPVECVVDCSVCAAVDSCAARDLWSDIAKLVTDYLRSRTVAELAELQVLKRAKASSASDPAA